MRWFLLLCIALTVGCSRTPSAEQPLPISYWYWHTPYALKADEVDTLKKMGVGRLFVRAGTFRNDGEKIVHDIPQRFDPTGAAFPVCLVYNFDPGALAHLGQFRPADMAKVIADRYQLDSATCKTQGISVEGLQLDIDFPTRQLPIYAALLKEVRQRIGPKTGLSITGLPTWLSSSDFRSVIDQVDFYAPQFYEGQAAKTVSDKAPLSDLEAMKKGIRAAESLGTPYQVGVPGYGRALLYDERGRILGGYRGMSAYDAARHPSFRLEERKREDGEDYYRFLAIANGADGRGKGYSLVFRIPTPEQIARHIEAARRTAGRYCQGIIVFRVPEEGESMAVRLTSAWAAIQKRDLRPKVKIATRRAADPWRRIEDPQSKEDPDKVWITLENVGVGGTEIGPTAVTVRLSVEPGTVRELVKGDFDAVETLRRLADDSTMKSSLHSANEIVFRRVHLAAGEKITMGPLTLSARATIECKYDLVSEASGDHIVGTQRIGWNAKG